MSTKKNKELLFERYSRNLDRIERKIPGVKKNSKTIYICPLCRFIFYQQHLSSIGGNYLTLEHILPSSVGGSETILTCKNCNNDHGGSLDHQLAKKLEMSRFSKGTAGANKKAAFRFVDDSESHGNIFFSQDGKPNILFDAKRTNPKYHDALKAMVLGKHCKINMTFTIPTYNANKFGLALLRFAHLKAFKELGYSYLFNWSSEIVRRAVQECDTESTALKGVLKIHDTNPLLGLNLIEAPKELRGYLVVVEISNEGISETYGIFLPGDLDQGEAAYTRLDDLRKSKQMTQEFKLQSLEGLDLCGEERCLLGLTYWGDKLRFVSPKNNKSKRSN